jgi:hypothetical protein
MPESGGGKGCSDHDDCETEKEIHRLVLLRRTLMEADKDAEAHAIACQLWEAPFCVKLFDSNDDASTQMKTEWKPRIFKQPEPVRIVIWEELTPLPLEPPTPEAPIAATAAETPTMQVPFLIGTVNNPHYSDRYKDTLQHLQDWQGQTNEFEVEPCYLLDLQEHPTIRVKTILYEGWRQHLMPRLLQLVAEELHTNVQLQQPPLFVLVGEDDIRMPSHLTPSGLYEICRDAFHNYPDLDLLSLGHSWKALSVKNRSQQQQQQQQQPAANKNKNQSLLSVLQAAAVKGGPAQGVHASTLVAIRLTGIYHLRDALEAAAAKKKQTHLDQFLFYSNYHHLKLALCDPPLVGWAEVDVTLTKSASGHRRRGGGRWSYLPPGPSVRSTDDMEQEDGRPLLLKSRDITWVRRRLEEAA